MCDNQNGTVKKAVPLESSTELSGLAKALEVLQNKSPDETVANIKHFLDSGHKVQKVMAAAKELGIDEALVAEAWTGGQCFGG